MGKFYTANEELTEYLVELGLTFHNREETEVMYFTDHSSGKQVRIEPTKKLVSLLDNQGIVVDYSSSYTDNQIKKFLEVTE